jgi:hypothetical protein
MIQKRSRARCSCRIQQLKGVFHQVGGMSAILIWIVRFNYFGHESLPEIARNEPNDKNHPISGFWSCQTST